MADSSGSAGGSRFLKGIVEGFYGRPWDAATRRAYADFLPSMGLNTYLYCPKADPHLRKLWHKPLPEGALASLQSLFSCYRQKGLQFGVGLSPFALYENYGATQRKLLRNKVEQLNTLEAPLLAILFDDMPGENDQLAQRQCEIVSDIVHWSSATRVLVCPTYYSFDPVLERHFGTRPNGYWQELGGGLEPEVEILWTGNQVCSDTISVADVIAIERKLGRRVVLWDNYPVNDGELRSKYLYLEKLHDRESGLANVLGGHLCNPMNQGVLSLAALAGLGELYGPVAVSSDRLLGEVWGSDVYRQLQLDFDNFQQLGLEGMSAGTRGELADKYARLAGEAAREVELWLRGAFTFDPACLTD